MMKTEPVPATVSPQDKIATYYVIPVAPGEGSTQNLVYYEAVSGAPKWQKVSSKNLNAIGQGKSASMIRLVQATAKQISEYTDLPSDILDPTANLYAGVARTLAQTDGLQSVYSLNTDGALVIPVLADTTRGLILLFTKSLGPGTAITQLIPSTDPQIKNSAGAKD
jgi:hypothetical protein